MKNKTFFLLVALVLGFATVNAQQSSNENYEYAMVEYIGSKTVYISSTDNANEERKTNITQSEFLQIIKEMNDKGWQVINAQYATGSQLIYFLQKMRTN